MKHPPEHTRELLSRLGNPQEGIKIIHVAGTNGKGSVCAYLNAMLLAGGKKTGLFTSPHLVRINERFQINGEDVSDEQFLDAFLKVEKAAKEYEAEGEALSKNAGSALKSVSPFLQPRTRTTVPSDRSSFARDTNFSCIVNPPI